MCKSLARMVSCFIFATTGFCYAEPVSGELTLDLQYSVFKVILASERDTALFISDSAQRLIVFDLRSAQTVHELSYKMIAPRLDFHDAAVGSNQRFAYFVGVELGKPGGGLLTQLNLDTFDERTLHFVEPFFLSTVAVDDGGEVFVGDMNSSTITIVEDALFKQEGSPLRRGDLPGNIYLRGGPAVEVEVFEGGGFVLASQGSMSKVSLVNVGTSEIVDEVAPAREEGTVLALTTATAKRPFGTGSVELLGIGKEGQSVLERLERPGIFDKQASLLIADYDADELVVFDLDPEFEALRFVATGKLGLRELPSQEPSGSEEIRSPLILSTDREQSIIVVGKRGASQVAFFSRVGPALERRNIVNLQEPISDIDVSPDGSLVTILNSPGKSLTVIRNPGEWLAEVGVFSGSDQIREAQRLLSELRYPVGVVDGLDGPRTRHAIALFQETVGFEPSGTVDQDTLQKIRDVAGEASHDGGGAATSSPSKDDFVAKHSPTCSPISAESLCGPRSINFYPRFESREIGGLICSHKASDPRLVQFDYYHVLGKGARDYACTAYRSCAFIRFQYPDAYQEFCEEF